MQCNKVRQAISLARYDGNTIDPVITRHLEQCAQCRSFANTDARLNELLQLDQPTVPGPGFDTRFFARLAEEKNAPKPSAISAGEMFVQWIRGWRWVLAGLSVASAVAIVLFIRHPAQPPLQGDELARLSPRDAELVQNLELVQELDLVRRLDEVETFELLAQLDIGEIEHARSQPTPNAVTAPQSVTGVSQ